MTELRRAGKYPDRSIWQRSFHDRIIRDDKEHYFVEQYISLNPVMWHLDRNNPGARKSTVDQLRQELRERHSLDEYAIEHVVDGWINRVRKTPGLELEKTR